MLVPYELDKFIKMSEKDTLLITLIDNYAEVWNESYLDKKKILLREIWSEHGEYIDPRVALKGIDALAHHIDKIQNTRPGFKIVRTSSIEIHHQIGRFKWQLLKDEMSFLEGMDIVLFTDDGKKIKKIIGFFGELGAIDK